MWKTQYNIFEEVNHRNKFITYVNLEYKHTVNNRYKYFQFKKFVICKFKKCWLRYSDFANV